ncbi:MAG: UDP-N-acetylmuramoyl-tripeptide--D-alanyl-D-alanine ligase [Verrucomicrobiota bacterium]
MSARGNEMKSLKLSEVAEYCGGSLLQGVPSQEATGVSTDTRTIGEGDVFVALKGENFNGHEYLEEAASKGCAVVMVSELPAASEAIECGIIHVGDTLKGLQQLAKRYRRALDLKVVVITGSSGKTSTKDMIDAVLRQRYRVNATRGNLNNHIGLPLTILRTEASDECGVWEIGMNHPGEIEVLAELAGPDVGVITNVGTAHIEYMGSRDAIALEKGMLAETVPEGGCVILNAGDDYTDAIAERTAARVVRAGIDAGEVSGRGVQPESGGSAFVLEAGGSEAEAFVPVPGRHMVGNALLAAAVGMELGMSGEEVAAGLREAKLTGGRLERKERDGVVYLDDSYNANPDSMRAALETLAGETVEGKRIAVLGRMAELGDAAETEHRGVGETVAALGIERLVTVGEDANLIKEGAGDGVEAAHFGTHAEAVAALRELVSSGDVVLLKGSRSAGMETVLEGLFAK